MMDRDDRNSRFRATGDANVPEEMVEIREPGHIENSYSDNIFLDTTLENGRSTGGVENRSTVSFSKQPSLKEVGIRVIAKLDEAENVKEGAQEYYVGTVAEPPSMPINKFRYLVFFDDGFVQYVDPKNVRVVPEGCVQVWNAVYPNYDCVQNYVRNYPEIPMAALSVGQMVATEWNGSWLMSRVLEKDCAMAKVCFCNDGQEEWIYRGSARFRPISRDLKIFTGPDAGNKVSLLDPSVCVEYQGRVRKIKIAEGAPQPREYFPHVCSPSCVIKFAPSTKTKKASPLMTPCLFGWKRDVYEDPQGPAILYRAPCGKTLKDEEDIAQFLDITKSNLSIDFFSFDCNVDCFNEFVPVRTIVNIADISKGKERAPVQCVNSLDEDHPPEMEFIAERVPGIHVELNTNKDFLVCCDCTDNCRDKAKCACWQLTMEGTSFQNLKEDGTKVKGYEHRRLEDTVNSGIYECNSRCKCRKTCSNRTIQNGAYWPLQLFKTSQKGWAVRTLYDIPKGSLVCVYSGEILNDTTAEIMGKKNGDEYFVQLDYIELNEKQKPNYTSDVDEDTEEKEEEKEKDEEDEDDNVDICFSKQRIRARLESLRSFVRQDRDNRAVPQPGKSSGKRFRHRGQPQKGKGATKAISKQSRTQKKRKNSKPKLSLKIKKIKTRHLYGSKEGYVVDAKRKGNTGRYFNHSCSPNLFVQNIFVDTHDMRFPHVALFTNQMIKAGTELTWSYGYDIGSLKGKILYCKCNSPYCVGRLL